MANSTSFSMRIVHYRLFKFEEKNGNLYVRIISGEVPISKADNTEFREFFDECFKILKNACALSPERWSSEPQCKKIVSKRKKRTLKRYSFPFSREIQLRRQKLERWKKLQLRSQIIRHPSRSLKKYFYPNFLVQPYFSPPWACT